MGRPNPISRFAELGGVALHYPAHHSMRRWSEKKKVLTYIGRLGDEIDFRDLATSVQTVAMAKLVGAAPVEGSDSDGFQACGSPGEVRNEPTLGIWHISCCILVMAC